MVKQKSKEEIIKLMKIIHQLFHAIIGLKKEGAEEDGDLSVMKSLLSVLKIHMLIQKNKKNIQNYLQIVQSIQNIFMEHKRDE